MTKRTSAKNVEIILAIRELQKIISDTETQDIIKILKQARDSLIKIYAKDNKEEFILAIRDLQKMILDTESQEVIKMLKEGRDTLIKIYAENNKEDAKQILSAIENMTNQ